MNDLRHSIILCPVGVVVVLSCSLLCRQRCDISCLMFSLLKNLAADRAETIPLLCRVFSSFVLLSVLGKICCQSRAVVTSSTLLLFLLEMTSHL